LSVEWASLKDIGGIFSFALIFASLILAVIAIIQALNSGDSLNHAASSVRESATEIKSISSTLSEVANKIHDVVSEVPKGLSAVEQKFDIANSALQKFANKDELAGGDYERQVKDSSVHGDMSNEVILSRVPHAALVPMHEFALALLGSKKLKMEDVFSDMNHRYYAISCIAMLKAFGKLDYEFSDSDAENIQLNVLNFSISADEILKNIKERLNHSPDAQPEVLIEYVGRLKSYQK
jgi:hypothetical protein